MWEDRLETQRPAEWEEPLQDYNICLKSAFVLLKRDFTRGHTELLHLTTLTLTKKICRGSLDRHICHTAKLRGASFTPDGYSEEATVEY